VPADLELEARFAAYRLSCPTRGVHPVTIAALALLGALFYLSLWRRRHRRRE